MKNALFLAGLALTAGCAPPEDEAPALVLLDAEALAAGAELQLGERFGSPVLPLLVEEGDDVAVHGPDGVESLDVQPGELAHVTAVKGIVVVEYRLLGEDVAADRLRLDADAEGARALADATGAGLQPGEDGVYLLKGEALLVEAALVEEPQGLFGAWPTEPTRQAGTRVRAEMGDALRIAGSSLRPAARQASRRSLPVGARLPADAPRDRPGEGEAAAGGEAGVLQPKGPDVRLVGLYRSESDEDCVLLDAAGGWARCATGLGRVRGRWTQGPGDVVLLHEGELQPQVLLFDASRRALSLPSEDEAIYLGPSLDLGLQPKPPPNPFARIP